MEFTRAVIQPKMFTRVGFPSALGPKRLNMGTVMTMRDAPKEKKKQLEETAVALPLEKTTKKKAAEPIKKKEKAVEEVTEVSLDPVREKLRQRLAYEADYIAKFSKGGDHKHGSDKNFEDFINRIDWNSQYVEDNIGDFVLMSEINHFEIKRDAPKETTKDIEMIEETAVESAEQKGKAVEVVTEVSLDPVAENFHQQRLIEEADYKATAELFSKRDDTKTLDNFIPKSEDDFVHYAELITNKLRPYEVQRRNSSMWKRRVMMRS